MRRNIFSLTAVVSLLTFTVCSCKKFVSLNAPPDQLVSSEVFTTDATAISAVLGIYAEMMNNANLFSSGQMTLLTGLAADELTYYSPSFRDEFLKNQITVTNHATIKSIFWQPAYKFIYAANLILEGVKQSSTLSPAVSSELEAEAKFIRAFNYFYLVNLFGDVPLILSTNYRDNSVMPRISSNRVYDQIIEDLEQAKDKLSSSFLSAGNTVSTERVRPTTWVAKALLARVYLYRSNWSAAAQQASDIMNSGVFDLVSNLDNVFLKNSGEAIWQLQPVNPSFNTWEGNGILPVSQVITPTYLLTPSVLNAFELGDKRRLSWVSTRSYLSQPVSHPYKYKVYGNNAPVTEYYTVFRLAEQYLIRAEARLMQSDLTGATADLNKIRTRAGLPNSIANDQASLLTAIKHERQVELFCEWGHRWLDLKRWNDATLVLNPLKGTTWQPTDVLWPIPEDQIRLNAALTQNPGY